ncbi:MAG: hypothetical protein KDI09_07800 [Halioglobus sp.]|nr:hypothetical protein [Halioglobus sp.]
MNTRRRNDPAKGGSHYRSERLQQDGGRWYFSTREGTLEGPYSDRLSAREAMERYVTIMNLQLIEPESKLSLSDVV